MVAEDSPAQLGGLLTGLVPGSRVAGYLLERLVGVGGTAAVFRARDERLGRVVALKLLTGDETVRQRFAREARAIAAVDHPHIIPVYEAGDAGGVLFIAMRFVAGDDLRVVVGREGSLRPRRAAAFISPVASALDAAHGAGLVHRDVKPANMLVDVGPGRPEHVYLSDFGLARGILSLGGPTMAGQFLGTPDYAAPEQISGRSVDGRADQYALGCVAYTLLSGSLPFVREEPMAVLYAHLSVPPPRVTLSRPDLPVAVNQVLARAMAKAPEDRYSSCGVFADALREALGVEPYDSSGRVRPSAQARVVAPAGPGCQRTVTAAPTGAGARRAAVPDGRAPATPVASRAAATVPLAVSPDSPATQLPAGTSPPAPTAMPPMTPPDPLLPPIAVETWTAVVAADRAYYDSVRAVSDQDAASICLPAHVPERRFRLSGTKVRIGRRSVSRRIEPEIDLTGPPTDTGVSRLHAVLIAGPDRSWSIVDPGSPNGIVVNGKDVPPGQAVPLRDGDRIHLGAWTVITIIRG
jgi:Protein kinase domain/FHA domain